MLHESVRRLSQSKDQAAAKHFLSFASLTYGMEISPLKEIGNCRTYLGRRLLLCATVAVLVACGFAIMIAAMINRDQDAFTVSDMASAAALTEINKCKGNDFICNTPGCVLAAAELLEYMDKSVDPCEDFYSFACGGFEARTFLPEDKARVNIDSLITDRVTQQLRFLMEKPIKEDVAEPFKLVKKLYQSCVNQTRLEELGLEPLKEVLKQFGGWPVVEGEKWNETDFVWYKIISKFQSYGYSVGYLVDFSVETDIKNSSSRIVKLDQPTMDNLDRKYLIKGLENVAVKAYLEFQIGFAKLLGADEESARIQQTKALEFEIMLAKICLPKEEQRDFNKLYNLMTITELSLRLPGITWLEYINIILAPQHIFIENEKVNVAAPDYFSKLIDLLAKTPKRTLANYLMWKVSFDSVDFLNEAARNLQLKYSAALYGTAERIPRWKECTDTVTDRLGFAVSALYVRKFFDEDARQLTKEMVDDIHTVFTEMINEADWMDTKTKIHARKKTASMNAQIAYPDELRDDKKLTDCYEKLTLNSDDYFGNVLNLGEFYINEDLKTLRESVDKNDWTIYGSYSTYVNAYYLGQHNTIQIPAGILQGTFFGKDRPAYLNYAAIGWTIGHEITHGFDDSGRQFNDEGNLVDWWEVSSKTNYLERVQCIIDQYSNYTVPQLGLNLNGINTQGENIADNGGLKAAYRAYIKWANRQTTGSENWDQVEQRLPGLSEYNVRQLFWLEAAMSWCDKMRPETLKLSILSGVHSPARFRVHGTLVNMPQFVSDFNCPVGSAMNPGLECTVW